MSGRRISMIVAALVVGATLVAGAMAAGQGYKQVGKWGKVGTGNGQFGNGVFGLATSKGGNVYAADTSNNRIQVFTAKGGFVDKFGALGGGNGQFSGPNDVAIAPDGSVFVADYSNNRVQKLSAGGGFQLAIPASQPTAVGVDAEGNLYVAELEGKVTRFDRASNYAPGTSWKGAARGGDLEVSADGSIYVSDTGGLRVARYSSQGKAMGSIRGGLSNPIGIGVDLDCNVWVGNISARRIAKFSPSGKMLATAASPDLVAQDIAVGRGGDVYAFDGSSRAMIRFAEDRSKPATANVPGTLTVAGGTAKIAYTLSGVACPTEVGATATLTGAGISGKAAGLKLKAGKNTITMKLSKAASGKATFKIVLKTNGRPTTETKSVTVNAK
jgi:sugar lactone lactonase YvrE